MDRSLYEAAMMDGASEGRIFWTITFPAITPIVFYLLTVCTIGAWQSMQEQQLLYPANAGLQYGAGALAEEALRLRHGMVPFLYTASYRTAKEGKALVEPLYYEWKTPQAYAYKEEYLFGDLLVAPVTSERAPDGYARVNAWLPEGRWTDIFTGDEYEIGEGGSERTLYRQLESIPVLIGAGGILPFSKDEGNGCDNPTRLEVWSYLGNGEYTLYEDGRERDKEGSFFTKFTARQTQTEGVCTHSLTISSEGDDEIIPKNRELSVKFKNITELARVRFFVDGRETKLVPWYADCASARFAFEAGKTYKIKVSFTPLTELETWKARAKKVLTQAEGLNVDKQRAYKALLKAETKEELLLALEPSPSLDYSPLPKITRLRLTETF